MKVESVDFFYLSMPEVLNIGDGSELNSAAMQKYLVPVENRIGGNVIYQTPSLT